VRPAALRKIPALPGNEVNDQESGGDLCVQACSDDPPVAFRAVRNLARSALADQEQTIGRRKYSGAPLGESSESDPLDLDAQRDGEPVIPVDAHVRLASPSFNDGERILRRGYSFTDGVDESLGELEAGLFFICFQRDPGRQFVPIQRRRVHQARRQRRLRGAARSAARRLRRRNPARLNPPTGLKVEPGFTFRPVGGVGWAPVWRAPDQAGQGRRRPNSGAIWPTEDAPHRAVSAAARRARGF
jgi:deferrochelatase/peroxidase EfeB